MSLRRKLLLLGFAFVVLTATLVYTGSPLVTTTTPIGIVSFELAFNGPQARAVLGSWDGAAREAAMLNLIVDFPYLVVYAWMLSLLCSAAASASQPTMSRAGTGLARYVWLAALFDVLENLALIRQLTTAPSDAAALFAGAAATAKFSVIAAALAYLLAAGAVTVFRR
jgi:hypothetical protein